VRRFSQVPGVGTGWTVGNRKIDHGMECMYFQVTKAVSNSLPFRDFIEMNMTN
jgi:hypothetical protein